MFGLLNKKIKIKLNTKQHVLAQSLQKENRKTDLGGL